MIYVLIPVFNEEENIAPLARSLEDTLKKTGRPWTIVFVNDGSNDRTAEAIDRLVKQNVPIETILNDPNQGAGASFENGFLYILEKGADPDIIVTMEGDNTCDLEILPDLIQTLESGKDFALASCYAPGGKLKDCPLERRFFSKAANWLCRILFRIKGARTYSSFYRAFQFKTIRQLYAMSGNRIITERGFVCMVELLLKLTRAGFHFSEVPCTLYFDKRLGSSKLKKKETIKAYLNLFYKDLSG